MKQRMAEVRRYRSELLTRIAAQREQMTEIGSEWKVPLALADQGVEAVRYLRRHHPMLVAGVVVVLLVIRRRGMAGLVGGLMGAWKGYRYITSLSAKLLSRG
ncbi:MAG: YqjK family protein [Gallionella sp.]